jgi:hypothetical protein
MIAMQTPLQFALITYRFDFVATLPSVLGKLPMPKCRGI